MIEEVVQNSVKVIVIEIFNCVVFTFGKILSLFHNFTKIIFINSLIIINIKIFMIEFEENIIIFIIFTCGVSLKLEIIIIIVILMSFNFKNFVSIHNYTHFYLYYLLKVSKVHNSIF